MCTSTLNAHLVASSCGSVLQKSHPSCTPCKVWIFVQLANPLSFCAAYNVFIYGAPCRVVNVIDMMTSGIFVHPAKLCEEAH